MKVAILQPLIPHYREDFFLKLKERVDCDIYITESDTTFKTNRMSKADVQTIHIANCSIFGRFLLYNPFPFFKRKYSAIVLMADMNHITTWLLLLLGFFMKKKIILWGQCISVSKYLKEEQKCNRYRKAMLAMADGLWVYMEKEAVQWRRIFPKKRIIALNNTISGIEEIVESNMDSEKEHLKQKYKIAQKQIFIFCARFNIPQRRIDLLEAIIDNLDRKKYGFIIIGDGVLKPDFSKYENVYDFGSCYEKNVKSELFTIADFYLQPGWIGLSVVEAMGYGKPILTFRRSNDVVQCVEYSYIIDGENGVLFDTIEEFVLFVENVTSDDVKRMGNNAKCMVREKLMISNMVENAISIL